MENEYRRLAIINNVLYMLADVMDSFIAEIPQHISVSRTIKQKFNPAQSNVRKLVKEIHKSLSEEEQEGFEMSADDLKQYIEEGIKEQLEIEKQQNNQNE